MKTVLGVIRMPVRGINKVKQELGFVLIALDIRNVNFDWNNIKIDVSSLLRNIYVPSS